ncbi:hypothetical protein [Flagellimonas myxillae]|uniref:hypothetical protein n=1 Tax=Flagellimonas myxillae TaxID=2942214 RepID=UPI00201EBD6E|nr:hypothetical protein [Muricauda myxillae]MCL6265234.1 hypothetical protein [Muricauda myxillae]
MQKKKVFSLFGVFLLIFSLFTSFVPSSSNKNSSAEELQQSLVLNTDGMYFAEFYDYIFRGQFEDVEFKREDTPFLMIFEQYLRAFGRQCPNALPSNKVQIMDWVCATEQVTTNGFGVETSRVCIDWTTVGSGLYARPDLYKAKLNLENMLSKDVFRKVVAMATDPNAIGNSLDMVHKANGLQNDMAQFFTLNNCNSPGLRRFEENLKRYAQAQPSLKMGGTSKYTAMKTSGGPTGSQNFTQLVNDLVANQSTTWAFNRYIPGSVSGLAIQRRDAQQRPVELKANYRYKGFAGSSDGWVRITFTNGLPKCIYFFDFPNNCKNANSSIVASYAQGKYAN